MHYLITFATQWGSRLGGINSFNTDFLEAFGAAYYNSVKVICIVADATDADIKKASNSHVILLSLPYTPQEKAFSKDQAQVGIDLLKQHGISFEPESTLWLGHDRITGAAAIEAASITGGRSALIHHMSYDHYESFAEDSQTAYLKSQEQRKLFEQSSLILAVGPLLRDAAQDLVGESKPVHMLIPGLAEIDVRSTPKTFSAFLSGRLSADAARIKQSHLGIAAFAHAHKMACENNMPDGLCKQPKLMLRGVDYAVEVTPTQLDGNPETELKIFAEEYAGRAINLQALPYIHDREELHGNISRASAAMMPSWHEGFGLVAWEAIAAGVPLIISKQSGVYRLLEEKFPGNGTGCVYPVDVRGSSTKPFFRPEDLSSVAEALKNIAHQPEKARQQAGTLRGLLINEYTWSTCAAQAANAFGWALQKGSLSQAEQMPITRVPVTIESQSISNDLLVHMPVKHLQAGAIIADSQLLRAEEALVPFESARQPELDKLDAWLDDAQYPQAVRLLTGAGGLGKTRLALHLCEQRIASGWHAGFLASEFDAKSLTTGWHALRALKQPLFIVVDYAETRQDDLLALIKVMLQSPSDLPVRLLLLARDGGEWWDSLPAKSQICEPLLSGYATSGPYRLPPLHNETQDRRQAYRQALYVFAKALDVPFADVTPELAGEHFGRPLYLQMAALLALRGERPTSAQGLTRALLSRERRYWCGLFSSHDLAEPERHAEQLLALTTLAGGFATPKAVLPHWEHANGAVLNAAQVARLFHALIPLYPGKQGLQAVRPDLLGEALVAQALLRPSAADLLDAVLGKDAGTSMRSNALTVLARISDNYQELHENLIEGLKRNFASCWQGFIGVAVETPSNLPILAEAAFDRLPVNIKDQITGLLKSQMSQQSVQLAQFYCLVSKFLVDKYNRKYLKKVNDIEAIQDYAGALNNYSNRLSEAGYNEEALEHGRQALEIYQKLVRKAPDRFEPDYAGPLNNYASYLRDAGRNEEALEHGQQALEIYQKLVRKAPDRFEPDHAGSLNNYANHLRDAGRNEEALEHSRQALEIYQRLARKDPDRFESDHAMLLSNYASHLSDAGCIEEALEHGRQALGIYQRLARKNPDRFESDHAMSLNNYANRLIDAGRNEEALEHGRQALEIRQRLARKAPDRFDPDHATSLSNYANHLRDAGRNEEALEHGRQALEIYQRLARKNPTVFAEEWFSTVCSTHFLEWMAGDTQAHGKPEELGSIPETTPMHRVPLLQIYASFVQACCASEQTGRSDAFKQVTSIWRDLPKSNRIAAQNYWMCAAAWCATHGPTSTENTDWQAEWHQFTKRRQGNVPSWMQEVARRLKFKWPE
ncbi:tetratricopeptide repeat protein [Burkholderia ubonensis]|uniref:tetratricopeptide repeat protein n=2 Tax=Burkholderia ubonensis TaxID=101571 RepID=UPI0009B4A46E|nr:tetratricopeptide repeat protein [Burkholderia ubonensis]